MKTPGRFLDRRIENVMQVEIFKGRIRANKPLSAALAGAAVVVGQNQTPKPCVMIMPGRGPEA